MVDAVCIDQENFRERGRQAELIELYTAKLMKFSFG
jgi:hypothetical protein